jgi:hypothetical protein
MTSDELNDQILDLCDNEALAPEALAGSGKAISYIGWFWRTVDFDSEWTLGILPEGASLIEGRYTRKAGFMENNKWDYEEFAPTPEERAAIRAALEEAAVRRNKSALQRVYDLMQAALERHTLAGKGEQ